MHYALFQIGLDKKGIMDVHEYSALHTFRDAIQDVDEPEESMPLKIVYGSYKPQPEHRDVDVIRTHMEQSRGFRLGHVMADGCRAIELCDFFAFEPLRRGLALDVPFAALIRTHVEMPTGDRQAVTAFLRYAEQMTPATNILNRPGVFALKAQERRPNGATVTRQNWCEFVDENRAVHAAQSAL
jgi:hypothetical protein